MTALPPEASRVPALDGVRGLAIALVMPFHFVSQYAPTQPLSLLGEVFRIGWAGVDLFFVLSGFLITGILIEQRGAHRYYAAFYWRRALRILPAFIVLMTIVWLMVILLPHLDPAGAQHFREWQPWYWTFTVNWLALGIGGAVALPYGTGLLWSLSVEENFYLVWPAVIAFAPTRALTRILWVLVGVAIAARIVLTLRGDPTNAAHTLTLSRLDALAAGALLAVAWREQKKRATLIAAVGRLANAPAHVWLGLAAGFYAVMRSLDSDGLPHAAPMRVIGFTLTAAVGALLIACALVARDSSALGRFCRLRVLRGLGRYAYALYLFHVLVALGFKMSGFTVDRLTAATRSVFVAEVVFTLVVGGASYLIAAASWRLVERPALELKDRVPYGRSPSMRHAQVGA
ncbi:MAG TPA: acyltransferase [Gemmatimonadaceae bacterium]|nr:acyltransferase [Gemmatimonadaceae bacterium]